MLHTSVTTYAWGCYLTIGVAWLIVSGPLVGSVMPRWLHTGADCVFVLMTAGFVWWMLRNCGRGACAPAPLVRPGDSDCSSQEPSGLVQGTDPVGQFAGALAHHFNNLLQVINGSSEVVYESLPPENPMKELLGNVLGAGRSAAELMKRLLVFSGRNPARRVRVDLNDVVASLLRVLEDTLDSRIQLSSALAQKPLLILGDCGLLEKMLVSLSTNASEAMRKGGVLSVTTESAVVSDDYCRENTWARPGSYAVVRVTDTGCGIGPDVRKRMFEPFFSTKVSGACAGLGLSTVSRVVDQHEGLIHVDSEVGKGTVMSVYVPIIAEAGEPAEPSLTVGAGSAKKAETILLVEDDDQVRLLMGLILKNAGYTVVEACNGLEALEVFQSMPGQIAGVVMDIVMPKMDGLEAYERIKGLSPQTPVTFASAFNERALHTNFEAHEDVFLLAKPFCRDELLGAVSRMLEVGVSA